MALQQKTPEAALLDGDVAPARLGGVSARCAAATTLPVLLVMAALGLSPEPSWQVGGTGHNALVELETPSKACQDLPNLQFEAIKRNNLGRQGPEKNKPEGLVYAAKARAFGNITDVEVELLASSETKFAHSFAEGTTLPAGDTSRQLKQQMTSGNLATVGVRPGTEAALTLRVRNLATAEYLQLSGLALTFFDLDTGRDANSSVEYVRVDGFKAFILTRASEVQVQRGHGTTGVTFMASTEGDMADGPEEPMRLTERQRNRAVSLELSEGTEATFHLGASDGDTARVIAFALQPALHCASTVLSDGTAVPPGVNQTQIALVRGSGGESRPAAVLVLALALLSSPCLVENRLIGFNSKP